MMRRMLLSLDPWLAPMMGGSVLGGLFFFFFPRFRRWLLLTLSLAFFIYFLGPKLLLGHLVFAGLWYAGLRWGSPSAGRRSMAAAFILILSTLIYLGVMNIRILYPDAEWKGVQALGLSYLFWRVVHVTLDWRKGILPTPPFGEFLNYVFYFPAQRGGPIVRYQEFAKAPFFKEEGWRPSLDRFMLLRIAGALGKLGILYYGLQLDYDSLWNETRELHYGLLAKILYIRAISFYFLVSGINDLIIVFSGMLKIPLPENYDYPYFRRNLAHFWRSWHITLMTCLKDYIYEPLGGRQRHQSLNYIITLLVVAFWHVTTPAFLIWGLWHGLGMVILRKWQDFWGRVPALGAWAFWLKGPQRLARSFPRATAFASGLFTFHFVALGWLPFWGGHPQGTTALLRLLGLGFLVPYIWQ